MSLLADLSDSLTRVMLQHEPYQIPLLHLNMPSYTSQRHLLPSLLASLTALVDALPQNRPVAVAQEESVVSKGMKVAQEYTLWVSIVVGKSIFRGLSTVFEAHV